MSATSISSGNLLIRTDASAEIGIGHVMRCLALAQAWRAAGGDAVFACAGTPAGLKERIEAARFEWLNLQSESATAQDAVETVSLARLRDVQWIVADGFQFGAKYQQQIKSAGLKLLLIDDGARCGEYYADAVLDQNFAAKETQYARREPCTQLLLGTQYVMLQDHFRRWYSWEKKIRASGEHLLVMTGGTDPDGLTLKIVRSLRELKLNMQIDVIAGGANSRIQQLQDVVERSGSRVRLHIEVGDPSVMMADADMAVTCGGGTLWELLFMCCPAMSFARDDIQSKIVSELDAEGATGYLGRAEDFDPNEFAAAIAELAHDSRRRQRMAATGRVLVDGCGAHRVVEAMLKINEGSVSLKSVSADERQEFMRMAGEHFRELNPNFVPQSDWKNSYFEKIKENPDVSLRWIIAGGQRAGFVLFGIERHRFLPREIGMVYELYVVPGMRKQGIAKACAEAVIRTLQESGPSRIQLEIATGNVVAERFWSSVGFQKTSERYVLTQERMGR